MASQPKFSHGINGYSRYDLPQSIGFTATPGILYVGRCEFLNMRDIRKIQAGVVCRAEPTVVPTFTPYSIRLHRFFVPMQLYHPEMRVNSSGFDMNKLSANLLPLSEGIKNTSLTGQDAPFLTFQKHSLFTQLQLASGGLAYSGRGADFYAEHPHTAPTGFVPAMGSSDVNADPILAYWDIVRCFYSYSSDRLYSMACRPLTMFHNIGAGTEQIAWMTGTGSASRPDSPGCKYDQYYCDLSVLDKYYETSFYPREDDTSTYYFRIDLFYTLYASVNKAEAVWSYEDFIRKTASTEVGTYHNYDRMISSTPLAVIPSCPDRFSRVLRTERTKDISLPSTLTVRQLAVYSRLQEYSDLLNAGGSRFSDWGFTFFGSKIPHIDRPILLYSSSIYMNSNPIFNQASDPGQGLGSYGGTLSAMDSFGKRQTYSFQEPGYLIDLISIRPMYYYSGIQADYARYDRGDYFNPLFNQIGYQSLPVCTFGSAFRPGFNGYVTAFKEPCFNEFRTSYDYVFGDFAQVPYFKDQTDLIRSAWVLQRNVTEASVLGDSYAMAVKFVDLQTVNTPFSVKTVDNFFINLYYNVESRTLVSKQFATSLASR